ncbi:hypothetical protein K435DRAFT_362897 [Dendrothele bispora CBS 962.96]|uniref:Uncharacterized protein n=1 Tax=Dendrothele bispora (strain CBS 962.96) TaxID=1314807 RepID=A0A4S8LD42_DENBC|nr:hypothetical protein K435DRAFT_362897 [Dendrothele bispora CBS 962.96]
MPRMLRATRPYPSAGSSSSPSEPLLNLFSQPLSRCLLLPFSSLPSEEGILHFYATSSPPKDPSSLASSESLLSPAFGLAIFKVLKPCLHLTHSNEGLRRRSQTHRNFLVPLVGTGSSCFQACMNIISDRTSIIALAYALLPAVEGLLLDMGLVRCSYTDIDECNVHDDNDKRKGYG